MAANIIAEGTKPSHISRERTRCLKFNLQFYCYATLTLLFPQKLAGVS